MFSLGGELWRADSDIDVAKAGSERLSTVIEHELGHALGIRHSPRYEGDVMSPVVRRGPLPLSAWDRAAFAYSGRGRCSP
ncbi:matrixin family metalloprotease [Nocardioides kongjuensis]|uniref:matrixin family metalloprotease n=1 Tax=Nocardioides kongjuensis TaxID=349522 RepID=UPI0035E55048